MSPSSTQTFFPAGDSPSPHLLDVCCWTSNLRKRAEAANFDFRLQARHSAFCIQRGCWRMGRLRRCGCGENWCGFICRMCCRS
jgi:hypothetical protein